MFSFVKVVKDFTIQKHGSCYFANLNNIDGTVFVGKFISLSLKEIESLIENYYK